MLELDNHAFRRTPEVVPRGEKNGMAKLTASKVRAARRLRKAGWSFADLARKFEMGESAMTGAVKGVTWKHVK